MDKNKLQKILAGLSNKNSGLGEAFKSVEKEMERVADKLREEAEIKTVENAKRKINELKQEIQDALQSLFKSFEVLKNELGQNEKDLIITLETKLNSLRTAMAELRTVGTEQAKNLSVEIEILKNEIKEIGERKIKIPDFKKDIDKLGAELNYLADSILSSKENEQEQSKKGKEFKKEFEVLKEDFTKLRRDTLSVVASHGGNANRNILVSGNSSVLSRYTDINLKPGANVTLTYTNNDNLKTTDLTIAATGGAGTSRSISTVSVSSVLADTAATDIVVIASAGVKLTLPTAVSNTNLYTVKNTATSSVMVDTTGGQTIDGDTNIILNTRYTAVDLISDNSNWHIT